MRRRSGSSREPMKLYSYWRSSAAYRVRIALNLKGLNAEIIPINLVKSEQKAPAYRAFNPQGLVPLLEDGSHAIAQSMAILEYLEETHPTPALLPTTPIERAKARALAQMVICDIHPLNNLRVLQYLQKNLGVGEADKSAWIQHWITAGFEAMETQVNKGGVGSFCVGASPSFADIALVPQLYNARRFGCDLTPFPTLTDIAARCEALPAFAAAHPDMQVDHS